VVWLALGAGALLLLLWLLRIFASTPVETVRKVGVWTLGVVGGGLLLTMLVTGRGSQALWTLFFFAPVIWRLVQSWRTAWLFGQRGGGGDAGGARAGGARAASADAAWR
jgi:hypothetical protein